MRKEIWQTVGKEHGEFVVKGTFDTPKEALDLANELNDSQSDFYYDYNKAINTEKENIVENFEVGMHTKEGDCCPECNTNWDGGDILEDMVKRKDSGIDDYYSNLSDEELIEAAGLYGWTPETKRRWGNVIGMELPYDDPEHYDGVSYWACPECGIAWDRWTGDRSDKFEKQITERNKKIDIMGETGSQGIGLKIKDEEKKHI